VIRERTDDADMGKAFRTSRAERQADRYLAQTIYPASPLNSGLLIHRIHPQSSPQRCLYFSRDELADVSTVHSDILDQGRTHE
jgi:hypothetical protein